MTNIGATSEENEKGDGNSNQPDTQPLNESKIQNGNEDAGDDEGVHLKKELGLVEGVESSLESL